MNNKDEEKLNQPIFKKFTFTVKQERPQIECMTLLSQVMSAYLDVNLLERQAIAAWFHMTYSSRK